MSEVFEKLSEFRQDDFILRVEFDCLTSTPQLLKELLALLQIHLHCIEPLVLGDQAFIEQNCKHVQQCSQVFHVGDISALLLEVIHQELQFLAYLLFGNLGDQNAQLLDEGLQWRFRGYFFTFLAFLFE